MTPLLRTTSVGRWLLLKRPSSMVVRYASQWDVVIAGGGLVGCATALALAKEPALKGRQILLLEAGSDRNYSLPQEYSNRVVALNNSSRRLFQRLGVWEKVEKGRCQTVKGMRVWDHASGMENMLSIDGDKNEGLFHIVENDLLLHSLTDQLKTCDSLSIQFGASLKECKYDSDDAIVNLELNDGSSTTSKLIIGAEGANSTVRKSMGPDIPYISKSYNQFGVVGVIKLKEGDSNDLAWQKFLTTGPIALLPLSKCHSSLVWTLPSKTAQEAMKKSPEEFLKLLKRNLGAKLPKDFVEIESISSIAGFPLGLGHASRYCQPGMILIGDAAHRVHPLAGQGVNLGFGDVECLAKLLSRNVINGERFISYSYLLQYESERQRHNVPMMLGIDFIQKIYGSDNPVVNAIRSFGVNMVNSSSLAKNMVARFAE